MCTVGKGMRRIVQTVGAVFAVIALILLIISVTTNYWLEIRIQRAGLTGGGLATYSRNRGLYQECWTGESAVQAAIENNAFTYSKECLYVDLGVVHNRPDVSISAEYEARRGLLIAMWVVLGLAAFFALIAIILYLYTLCQDVNKYQWKYGTKAAAGLMLAAVLFNGLGMALFHGAEHIELNSAADPNGVQAPYPSYFVADMSQDLANRTTRVYGWSYALCWCALACELLSAALFFNVICCYFKSKKKSVYSKPVRKQTTVVVEPRTNPAYVVHEKVVVAPPKVYMVEGNDYYDQRNSYRSYATDQSYNGYSPNYGYDQGYVIQ